MYSLRFAFPHQPYDGWVAAFAVYLHAALLGYALVAATVPAVMIVRTVPRARAWKLLGPAGQARQGGLPARVRFLHWRRSKTWHYGDIRIAGGEISWQSVDGSRTLPFTNACQSLAAQPPGGRPRRRTTLIGDNDARILVDLPRKVLVALARDLDQYSQALLDRQDPA